MWWFRLRQVSALSLCAVSCTCHSLTHESSAQQPTFCTGSGHELAASVCTVPALALCDSLAFSASHPRLTQQPPPITRPSSTAMSYRELRDFTEHMKTLGYPTAVSHASFRQPNFPLVASCLLFLLRRYDPTLITADDISTQQARITFIQSITQLLWSKCNVKLSMKQLYRADGYAVKEMLKLSAVLYAAMAANTGAATGGGPSGASTSPLAGDGASGVPASLDAFKAAKSLATALIDTADRLSELLGKEGSVRTARDTAITFVDQLNETTSTGSASNSSNNNVERHIKRQLQLIADNTAELKALTTATTTDVDKQRTKWERKVQERDRLTKRWQALRRVKPAFMEEYEREEKELRLLYSVYVERVRNVRWLEDEMRGMREEEEEERKERERQRAKVQKRMKEEERRMLRGEGDDDDGSGEEDEEDEGEDDDDEDDGGDRDEKRVYERKDRAGEDDEDDDEEGEGEEDDEEDIDGLDSEDEHKRPTRRPPQKQPANTAIMKGRDSRAPGGAAAASAKGKAGGHKDVDMGSDSDGSAMGDDDYF